MINAFSSMLGVVKSTNTHDDMEFFRCGLIHYIDIVMGLTYVGLILGPRNRVVE